MIPARNVNFGILRRNENILLSSRSGCVNGNSQGNCSRIIKICKCSFSVSNNAKANVQNINVNHRSQYQSSKYMMALGAAAAGSLTLGSVYSALTATKEAKNGNNSEDIIGKENNLNGIQSRVRKFSRSSANESKASLDNINMNLSLISSTVAETISLKGLHDRFTFLSSIEKEAPEIDDNTNNNVNDSGNKADTSVKKIKTAGNKAIGTGAFSKVFRARDNYAQKDVAIKVVKHKDMTADDLFHEVEVLRRVRGHENIIHLYQVLNCEEDDKYYIISELCNDGELLDMLIKYGPYNESSASSLAEKIASGLKHIHACGFVHCDIKPENIVFTNQNSKGLGKRNEDCRIIDFGVAREISDFEKDKELKQEKAEECIGTLAYSPPELVHLLKHPEEKYRYDLTNYDPRAIDFWALGVVLYITLFVCHPFDVLGRGDENDMTQKILKNEYSFNVHGPKLQVSTAAKDLISGLLHPDPKKRYKADVILSHDFIKNNKQHEAFNQRHLPSSWQSEEDHPGEPSKQDEALIAMLEKDEVSRQFLSDRTMETFGRALLIAALVNSLDASHISQSSDAFLRQAFDLISTSASRDNLDGHVTLEDIDKLFRSTGHNTSMTEASMYAKVAKQHIDFEQFKAILKYRGCASRTFRRGRPLFSQGDEPQGFYILTRGSCGLKIDNQDGFFSIAEAGSMFGEAALDQGRRDRAVSVIPLEKCDVTFIPKHMFFEALAGSAPLQAKIFEASRLQQAKRFRDLIDYLVRDSTLIKRDALERKQYKQGEYLYKIGEESESVFFVESGIIAAFSQCQKEDEFVEGPLTLRLALRGKGDFTGSSVFQKTKRYSSAQCVSDCEISILHRDDIERLMKENKALQFYLESQAQWRKEIWNQRLAEAERGITEPQLLPLMLEAQYQYSLAQKNNKNKKTKKEGDLDDVRQYARAVTLMQSKVYNAGEAIFEKGDTPSKFYIVNSGTAVAEMSVTTGEVMTMAQFEPGDHFGERSLLDNRAKHSQTVRCVVPCEILEMDKKTFFDLMGHGETLFARAISKASRMRQHRWGKNLLALAQSDEDFHAVKVKVLHANSKKNKHAPRHGGEVKSDPPYSTTKARKDLIRGLIDKLDKNTATAGSGFDEYSMTQGPHNADVQDHDETRLSFTNEESNSEQKENEHIVQRLYLKKGDVLFKKGEASDAIYYVHNGELQFKGDDDPLNKFEANKFQSGDSLGLESLSDGDVQEHACIVLSDRAVVSKIPRTTLKHLIKSHEFVSENHKRYSEMAAPLRELERNLSANINNNIVAKEKERQEGIFSFARAKLSGAPAKDKDISVMKQSLSYSEVMEELSKQ